MKLYNSLCLFNEQLVWILYIDSIVPSTDCTDISDTHRHSPHLPNNQSLPCYSTAVIFLLPDCILSKQTVSLKYSPHVNSHGTFNDEATDKAWEKY